MSGFDQNVFYTHYNNSLDAFNPEMWAMESVAILRESMVAADLVHRDFEPMFQRHGDVVNTRQPAEFVGKRKGVNDNVTIQNATATNIAVPLDQHVHTSFLIRDGEEAKAFKVLVDEYLRPATLSLARYVDKMVLAQYVHFLANQSGALGGLSTSNAVSVISNAGLVMDRNKAYPTGRNHIWTPEAQALLIQNPTFHQADRVGDNGTALREASIGRKLNFEHYMAQNMSQLLQTSTLLDTLDASAAAVKGATTLSVDGSTGASTNFAGRWFEVNGQVGHITAGTMSSNAGDLTLEFGLKEAVANNDVVNVYGGSLADSDYAAGYDGYIATDDGAGAQPEVPQVGQGITFGTSNVRYTIIDVDTTTSATETLIQLDRPLEAAVSNNDAVNYMPEGGGYNFAFHRNALTLAIRPMAAPRVGALAGVVSDAGATMRVVITYDGDKQGHLVTLDFLAGIKVLDTDLGAVTLT